MASIEQTLTDHPELGGLWTPSKADAPNYQAKVYNAGGGIRLAWPKSGGLLVELGGETGLVAPADFPPSR